MAVAYSDLSSYIFDSKKLSNAKSGSSGIQTHSSVKDNPIIEIHVACKNLIHVKTADNFNVLVVLQILDENRWPEISRTEIITGDPNPFFVKVFRAMYNFEIVQPLRFSVYSLDHPDVPISNDKLIGIGQTDVHTLVQSITSETIINLADNKGSFSGQLILTSEQIQQSLEIISASIRLRNLSKMRTFSKNYPYTIIYRTLGDKKDIPILRTEVYEKAFSCKFSPFEISMSSFCLGNAETNIKIVVYDHREKAADKEIGSYLTTFSSILKNPNEEHVIKNSTGKNVGHFSFSDFTILSHTTFLDYLRQGLQLNLVTAIDFTASNNSPSDPNSLHYCGNGQTSPYESCIWSVGRIVCPYDTDQLFPVYGFGGKIDGKKHFYFPLNFDAENPCVHGLNEIINVYRSALAKVTLCGPTLLSPVIKAVQKMADEAYKKSKTYTILLLITDGKINDFREAKDSIVAASNSPMSIIIIGVGFADFEDMKKLDSDDNLLVSSKGVSAVRDIAQFVPFYQCATSDGTLLAEEVLNEIPKQVQEFCEKHPF